jgi:hypothetical protein
VASGTDCPAPWQTADPRRKGSALAGCSAAFVRMVGKPETDNSAMTSGLPLTRVQSRTAFKNRIVKTRYVY